jgi:hypothetical protein
MVINQPKVKYYWLINQGNKPTILGFEKCLRHPENLQNLQKLS